MPCGRPGRTGSVVAAEAAPTRSIDVTPGTAPQ